MDETRIELLHNPYAFGYCLRYGKKDREGNWWVATDPAFITIEPGMTAPKPVLDITPTDAQFLFDGLWNMGYRPSDRLRDTRSMQDALERHLQDMRTLVFKDFPPQITIEGGRG